VRPTIHAVAKRAGVSIATVSRLLNGSTRVSEETAARVRRAIEEVGYLPNASARGLAMSANGTLAVIFPKLSGPFFSELIRGAEASARETGYHLLVYGDSSLAKATQEQMLGLLATKSDGLILASENIGLDYIRDVQRWGLPVVVLGRQPDDISVDSVRPDNINGAVKAVSHLIEHGYRRIAMITGRRTHLHAADREAGYRKALYDHGLPIISELVIPGAFDEESGYAATHLLLRMQPVPEAIFAANDEMAIGALAAVREKGLRVPADIALVGFDDIAQARYVQPSLTTVDQDMHGQAQIAVQMLLARVNGSDAETETRLVPTELVIRESCGCKSGSPAGAPVG
jgi:LacI family transcriptional regulator